MPRHQKTSPIYLDRLETIKVYILEFWEKHHYSPASNEIAAHFGVSTSVAAYWLRALVAAGWLERREPNVPRNVVPADIGKAIQGYFVQKEKEIAHDAEI